MRTSRPCRGQAAIEFAVGVFIFALIVGALVGFAPVFLKNMELQSAARCEAGQTALVAADGSESLPGPAAIVARAHPSPEVVGCDPWAYPIARMPDEPRFPEWRGDAVDPGRLVPGIRKKDFRFRMVVGGELLVDDIGWLSEEVYMPAMGGVNEKGGGR